MVSPGTADAGCTGGIEESDICTATRAEED